MTIQVNPRSALDSALCEYLTWDLGFFGLNIARLKTNTLNQSDIVDTLAWCEMNAIDCIYLLADPDHLETIMIAEDHEFRFVDIRLTLENNNSSQGCGEPENFPGTIRPFSMPDLPAIRDLARGSFRITRFYYDLNFPRSACDRLYETWIEKSCVQSYADGVLVAEIEDNIVGFITCKQQSASEGNIGLVGVGRTHQGMGIGQALVSAGLDWFAQRSIRKVSVVTQGRNVQAQRLYQRAGFLSQTLQLWYHNWFNVENP